MTAFYNEIDPFAAEWLRELIKAGHIAPGIVDERSIEDIEPDELTGFTQCHFFAGIGVWSYALRQAGWPDERPVWTGSCPCQPFSAAGKRKAEKDQRHLWPSWFNLIKTCKPRFVFGEQVASTEIVGTQLEIDFAIAVRKRDFARANKIAKKLVRSNGFHFTPRWLDALCGDFEKENYSVRPGVLGAHSVGAPQIRKRLYFAAAKQVADTAQQQLDRTQNIGEERGYEYSDSCNDVRVADSKGEQRTGEMHIKRGEPFPGGKGVEDRGRLHFGGLADTNSSGLQPRSEATEATRHGDTVDADGGLDRPEYSGPTNGHRRDADWLFCRDGKWRPVESRSESLADGLADRLGYSRIGDRYSLNPLIEKAENRVGRLRGYGNAIVAQQAQAFIEAFISTEK